MNIIAVVVTYNRIELLKRTVRCLQQNKPVSSIVVVNNGSTDSTVEWLETQPELIVINQANVGGSGGFYAGMRYAYQAGADWIWCMDDDVFPHADCLEQLLLHAGREDIGILAPRRLQEGKLFTHEFQGYNLINPFVSMYTGKLSKQTVTEPVEIQGAAFEGPFIRREVVEKIGYPNKDLFIFCDDTDYCLRTVKAGYKILYVPAALMDKEKFFSDDSWSERNKKKKWKRFYQIRNSAYLNHHYGGNWAVRYLRGFNGVAGYILTALATCPFTDAYQWSDIPKLWKAYRDGVNERLGKMNAY
ncbi:glycosyltransferase family 2 protein [uncultured Bacteroides sp.]|uniref:glycosyltransferase family 2 protein n=1 Tax=uncultured Bacteroides sp. TaxID=162156 RepID=UPI0025D97396|nr:glycosyltransferase family 2 protein [uncultured Bacteroides sp.]